MFDSALAIFLLAHLWGKKHGVCDAYKPTKSILLQRNRDNVPEVRHFGRCQGGYSPTKEQQSASHSTEAGEQGSSQVEKKTLSDNGKEGTCARMGEAGKGEHASQRMGTIFFTVILHVSTQNN